MKTQLFFKTLIIFLLLTQLFAQQIDELSNFQYNRQQFGSAFQQLDFQLQNLSSDFLINFQSHYTDPYLSTLIYRKINYGINEQYIQKVGEYFYLLGKMYLYDILPSNQKYANENREGRYMLAYFYLRIAAEQYECSEAYYYLSILDYLKISPMPLITNNLKKMIEANRKKQIISWHEDKEREELIEQLSSYHLHSIQHNLYLSSLQGNTQAMSVLAHMYKEGITAEVNCTTALSYYLSIVKNNKIDIFEFPSDDKLKDRVGVSFDKELYMNRELDLSQFKQHDLEPLLDTFIFTEETLSTYEEIALNYLSGSNGFPLNETRGAELFINMESQSKLARSMLGFLYLKGKGVKKDFQKVREIFQSSEAKMFKEILIIMKYFGLGFPNNDETRKLAIREMQTICNSYVKLRDMLQNQAKGSKISADEKSKYERIRTPLMKYMIGTLILGGDIVEKKQIAISLLEQSASEGSSLAMIQLGLIYADGTDARHDCKVAINYFDEEMKNNFYYTVKSDLAKEAIKKQKLMFALVKYIQLMSVGIKFSFVNSYYLLKIYGGDRVYQFNTNSWSIRSAQSTGLFKSLLEQQFITKTITDFLEEDLNPETKIIISRSILPALTEFKETEKPLHSLYSQYAFKKILAVGTEVHQLLILSFEEYKKNPSNLQLLDKIANTPSSLPQVYEARYLLGRHFQNNRTETNEQNRNKRAFEEYKRATKNNMLAHLIMIIEGGQIPQINALSHLAWYLSIIVIIWFFMNRQKKKRLEQIYENEMKKISEQNSANKDKNENGEEDNLQTDFQKMRDEMENSKEDTEYEIPRFSEQREQQIIRHQIQNKLVGFMQKKQQQQQQSFSTKFVKHEEKQPEQKSQSKKEQDHEFVDYRLFWQKKDEEEKQKIE